MAVTHAAGTAIQTLGLGSCVAVILLDPVHQQVGMVHIALPDSTIHPEKSKILPGYFADSGLPILVEKMKKDGSLSKGTVAKIVGGAAVMDPNSTFNIGKRNALAIKKILWGFRLGILAEDIGGNHSRSVVVDVDDGRVVVSVPGVGKHEI